MWKKRRFWPASSLSACLWELEWWDFARTKVGLFPLHIITGFTTAPVQSGISCTTRTNPVLEIFSIHTKEQGIKNELQRRLNWHRDEVTVSCPAVIAKCAAREIPALQEPGKLFYFFPWENCGFTPLKITSRSSRLSFNFSRGYSAFKSRKCLRSNTFPFPVLVLWAPACQCG